MPSLTSDREKRLWLSALAVTVAIYSTLGLAGELARELRRREVLDAAFTLAFLAVIAAVVGSSLKRRPGRHEAWVTVGVIAVVGMVGVRMGIGPEERTHLFEYGLLGVLLHEALDEGRRKGRNVPVPAVLAVVATGLLGWIDEGIQALLPNRVYDIRDIGTNALAGFMAVAASVSIRRARQRDIFRRGRPDA